jgi:shikimate kinase
MVITLIGPGGAGKSTVGGLIAERLGMTFVDLDRRFEARYGDIGEYINRFGYLTYARQNVETYMFSIANRGQCVAAVSSGFMTYPPDIHPDHARLRPNIDESPATFVLIPSLDRETCVAEIVQRQLARPFARTAAKEEEVIRERFPIYLGLRARKIETVRAVPAIVDEILIAVTNANELR